MKDATDQHHIRHCPLGNFATRGKNATKKHSHFAIFGERSNWSNHLKQEGSWWRIADPSPHPRTKQHQKEDVLESCLT